MMTQEEYHRKMMIKNIVDHPLWPEVISEVKEQLVRDLLITKESDKRDEIYWESQALDRIVGRLVAIANEVRMLKPNAA